MAFESMEHSCVVQSGPAEAVNAPFDAAAWLEQGRANLDKLPDGVVLPEAIDWAFEVWRAANEAQESGDENEDAITVIRNLCQPREQTNG